MKMIRTLTVIAVVFFFITGCQKETFCTYKLQPAANCSVSNYEIVFETTVEAVGDCSNGVGFKLNFPDPKITQYIQKWVVEGTVHTWEEGEKYGIPQTEKISLILYLNSPLPASLDVLVELEVVDGFDHQLAGKLFNCTNTAVCSVQLGDAKPTATPTTIDLVVPVTEFGSCPVSFEVTSTDITITNWIIQSAQTGITWQVGSVSSISGTKSITLKVNGTVKAGTFVVKVFDANGTLAQKLYTIGALGGGGTPCTASLGGMTGGVNANGGTFSIPIIWTGTCPVGFALTVANFTATSWSISNGTTPWTAGQTKQIVGGTVLTLTVNGVIPANQSVGITLTLLDANGSPLGYAFGSFLYGSGNQTCQVDPDPTSFTKVTSTSGIARFSIAFTGGCINPDVKLSILSSKLSFNTIKIVGEGPLNNQILLQNAALTVPINGSGTLNLRVEFTATAVLKSGDDIILNVEFNGTKVPAVVQIP